MSKDKQALFNDHNVEICLKEIYLSRICGSNYENQISFIKSFSKEKLLYLEELLMTDREKGAIKLFKQLIFLGNTA